MAYVRVFSGEVVISARRQSTKVTTGSPSFWQQRVSRFALGETEPYRGRPHLFGHLRATLRLQPREKTAALGDCGGGVGVGFVVAVAGLVAGGLGIANDVAGIVAATGL